MSPPRRNEDGLPRGRGQLVVPPGGASNVEDWRGANGAKTEKLRRSSLQRRARSQGIELRHSAYGFALVDATRKPIEDRRDLTLDEVESLLERG